MKIGIDISQTAYENTGVANFLKNLIENLLKIDQENEYIFLYSSFRKRPVLKNLPFLKNTDYKNFKIQYLPFPPRILDMLWNKLHILPIELFLGKIDIYISSDWTQPPVRSARSATILYDLSVYKFPEESGKLITETHKRRLKWVNKECDLIFCISESTKKDAEQILGLPENKLYVIYPGIC